VVRVERKRSGPSRMARSLHDVETALAYLHRVQARSGRYSNRCAVRHGAQLRYSATLVPWPAVARPGSRLARSQSDLDLERDRWNSCRWDRAATLHPKVVPADNLLVWEQAIARLLR